MKFFFPDDQDQVDLGFDFITEEHDPLRAHQRDDRYAHQVLHAAPYDGLLVSKATVDRTTSAQRHRLFNDGAEKFFELATGTTRLETIGDCGAFSYVSELYPPYTVDEVIDFYGGCGFDYGISVDHVIFGYDPSIDRDDPHIKESVRRQDITLKLASDFRKRCQTRGVDFIPIGVAQGWSPNSYAWAVAQLQDMGYDRIALGGMAPLKTHEILACLHAVDDVRHSTTQLHLPGITRCDNIAAFASLGVSSFDSTSPFRHAFKDDRDNYYTLDRTYAAVRVPQVDGNTQLKARICTEGISQNQLIKFERAALDLLRRYDRDEVDLDPVLDALHDYSRLWNDKTDRTDQYRMTLTDRPWRACPCSLCQHIGIEIVLFRGSERNKRRGFHNLYVFKRRLRKQLATEDR